MNNIIIRLESSSITFTSKNMFRDTEKNIRRAITDQIGPNLYISVDRQQQKVDLESGSDVGGAGPACVRIFSMPAGSHACLFSLAVSKQARFLVGLRCCCSRPYY